MANDVFTLDLISKAVKWAREHAQPDPMEITDPETGKKYFCFHPKYGLLTRVEFDALKEEFLDGQYNV